MATTKLVGGCLFFRQPHVFGLVFPWPPICGAPDGTAKRRGRFDLSLRLENPSEQLLEELVAGTRQAVGNGGNNGGGGLVIKPGVMRFFFINALFVSSSFLFLFCGQTRGKWFFWLHQPLAPFKKKPQRGYAENSNWGLNMGKRGCLTLACKREALTGMADT